MTDRIIVHNPYIMIHKTLIYGNYDKPHLTPTEFAVLCILTGLTTLDHEAIARALTIDPDTIQPAIDTLTAKGFIQTTPDLVHIIPNACPDTAADINHGRDNIHKTLGIEPPPLQREDPENNDDPTTTARNLIVANLPRPLLDAFRSRPAEANKLLIAVAAAITAGANTDLIGHALKEPLNGARSPIAVLLARLDPNSIRDAATAVTALATTKTPNGRIPQCGYCTGGAYIPGRAPAPEVRRTTDGSPCPHCHPDTTTKDHT